MVSRVADHPFKPKSIMKEREDFKTKQMLQNKIISPYIFAGLTTEKQGIVTGYTKRYDNEMGSFAELEKISSAVCTETGYSLSQLRTRKKGRIGVTTARQVFVLLAMDKGMTLTVVGRYIKRDHSCILYTNVTVRERLGLKGYELLTSIYNQVRHTL